MQFLTLGIVWIMPLWTKNKRKFNQSLNLFLFHFSHEPTSFIKNARLIDGKSKTLNSLLRIWFMIVILLQKYWREYVHF